MAMSEMEGDLLDPSSSDRGNALISLEDCKCPICMEYFIDVVETRCNHKFCNFCLTNWLRVSVNRKCPTCRSTILGSIEVKPDLQMLVNLTIGSVLDDASKREREEIKTERQAQIERFSSAREHTQSLLARITSGVSSSRPRSRLFDSENVRETIIPPYLTQHILDWWDENEEDSRRPETPPTAPSSDGIPFRRSLSQAASSFTQSYHQHLVSEYRYHLERLSSAHSRIREAYRDFNYHNGRMVEILDEQRASGSHPASDDNRITYEDYGDLLRAEMNEILNNSAPSQVPFREGSSSRDTGQLRSPLIDQTLAASSRRLAGFVGLGNNGEISHRTSALDMEQIINHRRSQLLQLSSIIRQWDSAGPVTSQGSSTSPFFLTPPVTVFQGSEARSSGTPSGSMQHQHVFFDTLVRGNDSTTTCPRRFRRGLRSNVFRTRPDPLANNVSQDILLPSMIPLGDSSSLSLPNNDQSGSFPPGEETERLLIPRCTRRLGSGSVQFRNLSSESDDEEPATRRRSLNIGSRPRTASVPSRRRVSSVRNFRRRGSPFFERSSANPPISLAGPLVQRECNLDGPVTQPSPGREQDEQRQDAQGQGVADAAGPSASPSPGHVQDSLSQSVNDLSSMSEYLKTICDRFRTR